jgi:hypothetical protein
MAYVNGLYWRELRAVDMKVWTDLCSGNILAIDSAASAAHVENLQQVSHNRWDKFATYPQRLGQLFELPTLSTALLLLFFSNFFIRKIVAENVRL